MPRTARIKDDSKIYHIMLRGNARQQIFYDEEDFRYFIGLLRRYKNVCGYEIYAYVLMGNHVHLLMKEGKEALGTVFRRLGPAFANWYNGKYERIGHIFQDRYKSEPVGADSYFNTVLRYIIQNPVAAGLCENAEDYLYSSAREYLCGEQGITDTAFAIEINGLENLREYLRQPEEQECMEDQKTVSRRLSDEAAAKLIQEEFGTLTPNPGRAKERAEFAGSVRKLRGKGISLRQFSRLTGISKKIIESCR